MARKKNTAETGAANGTPIDNTNKATTTGGTAGDAFDTVTISGSPTIEISTAQFMHGTRSYHINGGTSTTGYFRWNVNSSPASGKFYIRFVTSIPNVVVFFELRDNAGTPARMFSIQTQNTGKIQILDRAGTLLAGWTSDTFNAGVWYRFEWECQKGTGAGPSSTDGKVNVRKYIGDSTTADQTLSTAACDTGVLDAGHARLGKQTGSPAQEMYIDTAVVDTATFAAVGPEGANAAPVPSLTGSSVITAVAGTGTISLAGAATDDVAVTSLLWTKTSGPSSAPGSTSTTGINSTSATGTATADGVPGTSVYRLTASDVAPLTAYVEVTVHVHPAPGDTWPVVAVGANDWSSFGGAANALAGVTDGLDTTGQETADLTSTPQVQKFTCPPVGLGAIKIDVTGLKTAATTVIRDWTLYKADGVSVISTGTMSPGQAVGTLTALVTDPTKLALVPTELDRVALVLGVASRI